MQVRSARTISFEVRSCPSFRLVTSRPLILHALGITPRVPHAKARWLNALSCAGIALLRPNDLLTILLSASLMATLVDVCR